jgi:hypothetical protein
LPASVSRFGVNTTSQRGWGFFDRLFGDFSAGADSYTPITSIRGLPAFLTTFEAVTLPVGNKCDRSGYDENWT